MSVSKRLGEGPPALKPNTVGVFQSENGAKSLLAPVREQVKGPVLTQTSDWEFVFDLEHEELGHSKSRRGFPIVSIESTKRPDAVIWSESIKTVIWIELTSPWEELMDMRHFEKQHRYSQLKIDCEEAGWKVFDHSVEVGCRGYVNPTGWHPMCRTIGLTNREKARLKLAVEETAQQCSHAIFAYRYQWEWHPRPPLDVSLWHK